MEHAGGAVGVQSDYIVAMPRAKLLTILFIGSIIVPFSGLAKLKYMRDPTKQPHKELQWRPWAKAVIHPRRTTAPAEHPSVPEVDLEVEARFEIPR